MGTRSIAGSARILDCAAFTRARVSMSDSRGCVASRIRLGGSWRIAVLLVAFLLSLCVGVAPAEAAGEGASSCEGDGALISALPTPPASSGDEPLAVNEGDEASLAEKREAQTGAAGECADPGISGDGELVVADSEADAPALVAELRQDRLCIRVADKTGDSSPDVDASQGDIPRPHLLSAGPSINVLENVEAPQDISSSVDRRQDDATFVYDLGDGVISGEHAPWYDKRGAIRYVEFGEGVRPYSMARWFTDLNELRYIDFNGLDTSRVCDMQSLFSDCWSLTSLDLSCFNTSYVKSMAQMFSGCARIESLDLSTFDTSSVTSMSGMFADNRALKYVNLSSFNTSNVTDMSAMFQGCSSVAALDLSSFNTTKVVSLGGMFSGCSSLAALDVSGFEAEQLSAAAIPLDNPGGFWRMNAPAGYVSGITLREPTDEEKALNGVVDAPQPSNGQTSEPKAEGEKASPGNPSEAKVDVRDPVVPSATSPSVDAQVDQGESGASAPEYGYGTDTVSPPPTSPLANTVVLDAVGDLAATIAAPIAQVVVDPGIVVPDPAAVTDWINGFFSPNAVVDKTLSMVAAAFGMIVAACLLLMICLKIH